MNPTQVVLLTCVLMVTHYLFHDFTTSLYWPSKSFERQLCLSYSSNMFDRVMRNTTCGVIYCSLPTGRYLYIYIALVHRFSRTARRRFKFNDLVVVQKTPAQCHWMELTLHAKTIIFKSSGKPAGSPLTTFFGNHNQV